MAKLIILTGDKQSGKTSFLRSWLKHMDASGILSPIVDGQRMLYSIADHVYFSFESPSKTDETISVGRFHFYQEAFITANRIIGKGVGSRWLVIDEIGPLELQEQGFFSSLTIILKQPPQNLILVVRIGLIDQVIDKFSIQHAIILSNDQLKKEEF
jgi:nucleoside-triphosphatase THEP1